MSWSIGRKLYSGTSVLIALLAVTGAGALVALRDMHDELETAANRTARKLELSLVVEANLIAMKAGERRVLLAAFGRDASLGAEAVKEIVTARTAIEQTTAELEPLLVTAEGRGFVDDMTAAVGMWTDVDAEVQRLAAASEPERAWAKAVADANPLLDRATGLATRLVAQQRDMFDASLVSAQTSYARTLAAMIAIIGIGMLVAGVVMWTVRGVTRVLGHTSSELQAGSEQVVSAAAQVATSAEALSQGASEQAASLEEISASMEEMASMARANSDSSVQVVDLMSSTSVAVSDANQSIEQMVVSMGAIVDSSGKVGKILKTIDEIAFQTNLLALNAAVEAARAGDAGLGFAVVADEVRSLAQRSAAAARDTAELIDEAIGNASTGEKRVRDVSNAIENITQTIAQVKRLVDDVSSASVQQAEGVNQVAQAVAQMEQVTQSNAASAEESAAASEELNSQAETTMNAVARLEAMVRGGRATEGVTLVPLAASQAPGDQVTPARLREAA